MHGFFISYRLYEKAKAVADPFAYDRYRRQKIREKLEAQPRFKVKSELPKVNKELAKKLLDESVKDTALQDDRFKAMFENPDFEVHKSADEYRLLAPVLDNLEKKRVQKVEQQKEIKDETQEDENTSDGEDLFYKSDHSDSNDSSDEDRSWVKDMKSEYKKIRADRSKEDDTQDRIKVQEVDDDSFNLKKSLMKRKNKSG